MTTDECDRFYTTAPDLALGLLSGDDRGAALNHLATCGGCRQHLEGLVRVADELLLLAPAIEPEIGFESRVMARLEASGAFTQATPQKPLYTSPADPPHTSPADPPHTSPVNPPHTWPVNPRRNPPHKGPQTSGRRPTSGRRRTRSPVLAAAAALIVVASVTGMVAGWRQAHDDGRASALRQEAQGAQRLDARTVVVWADGGRSTCQLVAFPRMGAQPARLVIHLDEPGEQRSSYQVVAQPTDGHLGVVVGTINMDNGQGTLAASIPAGTGPVHAVRVMEGSSTKYWATFAPV